ncbi:hypothetical protein HPP92_021467 [Vanilla planifolia]|uniref:Uncharacterized protein n=1 Tax=Vanilla planifolia TaxID=51239 RepID=A0A835UHL0_VANPL|nr:hypothetical protein HPP92_021467 [Vanilla planifolia]
MFGSDMDWWVEEPGWSQAIGRRLASLRSPQPMPPILQSLLHAIVSTRSCSLLHLADLDPFFRAWEGGFASGALLGRLQRDSSRSFDTADEAFPQHLRKIVSEGNAYKTKKQLGLVGITEWSPIQVLDEEALAAKELARSSFTHRKMLTKLNKEEP